MALPEMTCMASKTLIEYAYNNKIPTYQHTQVFFSTMDKNVTRVTEKNILLNPIKKGRQNGEIG
jgi:hypothetical protein